jgi:hypothetical protein
MDKERIIDALSLFRTKDTYSAALNFWNTLGYVSDRQPELNSFSFDELRKNIDSNVKPEKLKSEDWVNLKYIFQITDEEIRYLSGKMKQYEILKSDEDKFNNYDINSYLFSVLELKGSSYNRSILSDITRFINKHYLIPTILTIKYGDNISIAICDRRINKKDQNRDVIEKVTLIKDINIVNPHRAHLEILSEISIAGLISTGYIINNFNTLHNAWRDVLNIEELNNRFYINIRDWFYNARNTVTFPINGDNSESNRTENLIRLLTRMIFIWFIKEKGLVDNRLFDFELLKDGYLNPECKENSQYYKAILQNLFFATLNNEMNKDNPEFCRQFMPDKRYFKNGYRNQFYYRYGRMFKDTDVALKLFEDTPFLNGGLFECLDNNATNERKDYFTNPLENKDLIYVPDELFFNLDEKGKPIGLIDIFKHYKFTIEENTPIEEEIALDPELLGKVFESLLSEWDVQNEKTKKKNTGSYYTPREIVDYMVTEALITYLDSFCQENNIFIYDKIRILFKYTTIVPDLSSTEVNILIQGLSNVKILDPACGSGAFPMGMLHKIVFVLGKLDPDNVLFKEEQKLIAQRAIEEDINRANEINDPEARTQAEDVLLRKMERLEEVFSEKNPEYFDYARKLYIIENCIYGVDIQPIAIQIAKLRFFISLIIEQEKDSSKKNYGLIPLPNLETKLISANSLIPLMRKIKDEIFYTEIELLEIKLKETRKRYFFSKSNDEKRELRNQDNNLRIKMMNIIKSYIHGNIPYEWEIMINWNPFDSSKSAEFFDPFWMFNLSGIETDEISALKDKEQSYNKCFDIVLGNPPYVRADNPSIIDQRNLIKDTRYYETLYEKWDLYIPFLERSFKLLKPKGLFSFIISDAYIASKYAQLSQEYFLNNAAINRIDFFSEIKLFDAAVRNIIIQVQNKDNSNNIPLRLIHKENFGTVTKLPEKKQTEFSVDIFKPYNTNVIGEFNNNLKWGEICYVSKGMVLNSHEEFAKGEFVKNDLIQDYSDETHYKEYIEAKWISRYNIVETKYLEWNTVRVPAFISRPTFPELYKHPKLMAGGMTGAIYDDNGLLCNHSIIVSVLWKDLKNVFNKSISGSIKKDFKLSENLNIFREKLERNSELFELKYLLAILNSTYAKYFLKTVQRSQIGIYPDDIKKIPVPVVEKNIQEPFCILVDYIMFINQCYKPLIENFGNNIISDEFDRVLDYIVLELYFNSEMQKNNLSFIKESTSIVKPINQLDDENEKKDIIIQCYDTMTNSSSPIRNNISLANIKLEHIIKEIRRK